MVWWSSNTVCDVGIQRVRPGGFLSMASIRNHSLRQSNTVWDAGLIETGQRTMLSRQINGQLLFVGTDWVMQCVNQSISWRVRSLRKVQFSQAKYRAIELAEDKNS